MKELESEIVERLENEKINDDIKKIYKKFLEDYNKFINNKEKENDLNKKGNQFLKKKKKRK